MKNNESKMNELNEKNLSKVNGGNVAASHCETGGEVPPLREQKRPNTHNIKVDKIK
ncbi:MAG: bacteriocin [Lachnospiraceae bacterium]|nr:bacteriocin [Lachnospiraceae bacterium]